MGSQQNYKIFDLGELDFEATALHFFQRQYRDNPVYQSYVNALGIRVSEVDAIAGIPFLPIRFFKSHEIKTGDFKAELLFESSGTTGMINSKHLVKDAEIYRQSFARGFERVYGNPKKFCILGLLPSYLERKNSSLVYMVDWLIRESAHPMSGFYLDDMKSLQEKIITLEQQSIPTILIGVSFALLDFAEKFPVKMKHTIVMETGGMKGRRRELVRDELHTILKNAFGVKTIHSEYGMTELLSQAYSTGHGKFSTPPWMKILLRDDSDPLSVIEQSSSALSGAINVIDLANLHSCSFIATDDAGRLHPDGKFEILGRIDGSDLRGCSLMAI